MDLFILEFLPIMPSART